MPECFAYFDLFAGPGVYEDGHEQDVDAMLELYDDADQLTFDDDVATNSKKVATINNNTDDKTITDSQNVATKGKRKVILDYLSQHHNATTKELSQLLGVSTARVKVYLAELEKAGLIMPHGANKNRTYTLK